jgi:hypothetical protein
VTKPPPAGTNATERVTALLRGRRGQIVLWGVLALPRAVVGSVSVASDLTRRGVAFHAAEPWIWELSSALALLIWLLPVLRLDDVLRARWRSAPARVGAYLIASGAFCVAHVATMVGLRHAVYALAGWHYDFGPWADSLLYEYPKDALTFAMVIGVAAVWRRLVGERPAAGAPTGALGPGANGPAESMPDANAASLSTSIADAVTVAAPMVPPTFLVRTAQGDLLVRTEQIDWIEAQGNYVALHVDGQVRLLRATLAEIGARLAPHGFIRTHRRALVNRERMQAILPPELGELGVRLQNGQIAPLSESRRAEVLRLVLGSPAAPQ